MAQTRNWAGDFFEGLTAALLHANRHKTDSRATVCPDLSIGDRDYFESKSVGKTGAVIVYDSRLEKDLKWTGETGAALHYVVWRHKSGCTGFKLRSALWANLAETAYEALIFPLATLAELCDAAPKRVVNNGGKGGDGKAWGYGSRGYREGWMINANRIKALCPVIGCAAATDAEGNRIFADGFPVFCGGGAERYLARASGAEAIPIRTRQADAV